MLVDYMLAFKVAYNKDLPKEEQRRWVDSLDMIKKAKEEEQKRLENMPKFDIEEFISRRDKIANSKGGA